MGTVFRNNPSEEQELLESQKVYQQEYLRKMYIKLQLAIVAVFCIFAVALANPKEDHGIWLHGNDIPPPPPPQGPGAPPPPQGPRPPVKRSAEPFEMQPGLMDHTKS